MHGGVSSYRVLVGYHGSPSSIAALERAVDFVRHERAQLIVVLVLEQTWLGFFASLEPSVYALRRVADAELVAGLRRAVSSLPPDVSVTTMVRRGRVARQLAAAATELNCATIVIGASRGPMLGRHRRLAALRRATSAEVLMAPARRPASAATTG
jgi:nucleotide-binding universal stress UspA family protein